MAHLGAKATWTAQTRGDCLFGVEDGHADLNKANNGWVYTKQVVDEGLNTRRKR